MHRLTEDEAGAFQDLLDLAVNKKIITKDSIIKFMNQEKNRIEQEHKRLLEE